MMLLATATAIDVLFCNISDDPLLCETENWAGGVAIQLHCGSVESKMEERSKRERIEKICGREKKSFPFSTVHRIRSSLGQSILLTVHSSMYSLVACSYLCEKIHDSSCWTISILTFYSSIHLICVMFSYINLILTKDNGLDLL